MERGGLYTCPRYPACVHMRVRACVCVCVCVCVYMPQVSAAMGIFRPTICSHTPQLKNVTFQYGK